MGKINRANWQQYTADGNEDDYYGFPSTTEYAILKGPNYTRLEIMGDGPPGSNHNNAPNGSTYIDMTNLKPYLKTGASTWALYSAIV